MGLSEDPEDKVHEEIIMTNEEKQNLLSLGFTEEEIENMDEEEFNQNKGLYGEVISKETKYYRVVEIIPSENINDGKLTLMSSKSGISEDYTDGYTEEISEKEYMIATTQLNSGSKLSGQVSINAYSPGKSVTSYKTMTTTIVHLSGDAYRVKSNVHWDSKMPVNRKIDVLGTSINPSYWRPEGGNYGKQTWKIFNSSTGTNTTGSATYSSTSNKWSHAEKGYALKMNLKDDISSKEKVTDINLYMYYTVKPYGSKKALDAYGKYSHQETSIEITPAISFSGDIAYSISQKTSFTYTTTHAYLTF